ncbi:hypothetical protein D3C75_1094480 [compost metagenome]
MARFPVSYPVTVPTVMWINGMTTLPLLVRYRHALLWAEVWITVSRSAAIVMSALVLWLTMWRVALVRWAAIMPVRRARLREACQRCAEHERGADHG